ncbi:hypothetical protein CANCADRAFT_87196 [Tortispora caseinolytica NRRL Y-17796]|uniref:Ribosomal protein L29 n=1 Tax=Tortispora caseinolytica NRRL Y-17796 TaxID=767744 RepID=A0A1E4TL23_9ASCO|nr:hypothetical protein CANCADRAFT_87196 [Tortispora caseinolytica NRRL Y-17796]
MVKAFELRTKSVEELQAQLVELKGDLQKYRMQKASNTGSRLAQIGVIRKDIARVLTVINQQQRAKAREQYSKVKKNRVPLDLRAKKTRALRRALTDFEKSRKTEKQRKKDVNFPQRKYAIKA